MRKFLGTLVILVVIVGGIGWVRGWFSIQTSSEDGSTNIEVSIDKDQIKEDAKNAADKARDMTDSLGEDNQEAGSDSTPN